MPGGLHAPISVLQTWRPNYVDPEMRDMMFLCFIAALLASSYFVVALRLWARFKLTNNAGLDDLLILFNLFPLTGLSVAMYLAFTRFGMNKHVWDSTPDALVGARKISMITEILYMWSTCMTKISILLFYRRFAIGTISNRFIYTIYAAIGFVIAYIITFHLTLFLHCRPFESYWKQADFRWYFKHKGTATRKADFVCSSEGEELIASSVISILQDFLAVGIPMFLFWKLRVSWKQRMALVGVFGIGVFVGICGILRLIFIIKIYFRTYDMTWESYWAWIWLVVEANFAVICASAPALKTFFKHTFEGITLPTSGHKRSYSDIEGGGPWLEKTLSYPTPSYTKFPSITSVEVLEQSVANKAKRLPKKNWQRLSF
ncbi:hypothetical protein EG328_004167 [Venturia inaequalis]|uniref:Rhodopsin domain-containing protein n=1 Tax=Venturia inaequalis TaxID=5025 RepID=A0A8H3UR86_VENIN|nr:hypothetical protein EG328_004167 [Venturia inaequalis]